MEEFSDASSISELWTQCERELGLSSKTRVTVRQIDPFRRVYVGSDQVVKVEFLERMLTASVRRRGLEGELQIYKDCQHTKGVGRAIALTAKNEYTALYLERHAGEPFDVENASWVQVFSVVIQLVAISLRLAKLGVAHNDFIPSNILIGTSGEVSLIDFDQATKSTQFSATTRGLFGFPDKEQMVTRSVFHIARLKLQATMLRILPQSFVKYLRNLKYAGLRRQNARKLPNLPANASASQKTFIDAWRIAQKSMANAPGAGLAYYEVEVDGVVFPGERPWADRWQVLSKVVGYDNKKVLEIGCNMGLLSSNLMKHAGAQAAFATDIDEDIIGAAKKVASALEVNVEFDIVDFDSQTPWESKLAEFQPDIVFALNVLNWVKDKDRLMKFLGRFDCVVFEGHDDFEIEKERFSSVGFARIDLVSMSERDRPLMLCRK